VSVVVSGASTGHWRPSTTTLDLLPPSSTLGYYHHMLLHPKLAPWQLKEGYKNPSLLWKFFKFFGLFSYGCCLFHQKECIHIIFLSSLETFDFWARVLDFDYVNWFEQELN